MVGLIILIFILLVALLAPIVVPFPEAANRANPLARDQAPNEIYYFGTDRIGRDIFSRVLLGTVLALRVGASPSL